MRASVLAPNSNTLSSRKNLQPSTTISQHPDSTTCIMAKLLDLPQELLLDIVERLEGSENASVAALCLASRACVGFSRPSLYRHVRIHRDSSNPIQIALLLRTAFDRPDLVAQTTIIDIETSVFINAGAQWLVPSGATRMRLKDGTRLEDVSLNHYRSLMRSSAPGISAMVQDWRPSLRNGDQTAYLGVLLSLLVGIKDLAITIYNEDGSPMRSSEPLERLFGLSTEIRRANMGIAPRPHLPLITHMRNVTQLKTASANLALLSLGFENLRSLEINFTESKDPSRYCINEMVGLYPCSLPKVQSLKIHIYWEDLLEESDAELDRFFINCHFPKLTQLHVNLSQSYSINLGLQLGSIYYLLEGLETVMSSVQKFTLSVSNDRSCFTSTAFHQIRPLDPTDGMLKAYGRLHTLSVPNVVLVNPGVHGYDTYSTTPLTLDDLPPSLKHLTISYPSAETLDWLLDTFNMADHVHSEVQTVTLLCAWDWGKPPSWFHHRRKVLDSLPVRVIVGVVQGQKEPEDYIDKEIGLFDAQTNEADLLVGLFGDLLD
jgi:hypothetical protein